jgi:hypothetical protein
VKLLLCLLSGLNCFSSVEKSETHFLSNKLVLISLNFCRRLYKRERIHQNSCVMDMYYLICFIESSMVFLTFEIHIYIYIYIFFFNLGHPVVLYIFQGSF